MLLSYAIGAEKACIMWFQIGVMRVGKGFIPFPSKYHFALHSKEKCSSFRGSFPFRSFLKCSVASIGKGEHFRKNRSFLLVGNIPNPFETEYYINIILLDSI